MNNGIQGSKERSQDFVGLDTPQNQKNIHNTLEYKEATIQTSKIPLLIHKTKKYTNIKN